MLNPFQTHRSPADRQPAPRFADGGGPLNNRRRICVIALKPVRRTIHVLRQIDYLSPHYDLTVVGHGEPDPRWPPLTWHAVPAATSSAAERIVKLAWYVPGRLRPACYEAWYWGVPRHRLALQAAL